jgi:hypothetical protein
MDVVSKYTNQLIQDPYGNYVLQETLDKWHDTDAELHEDENNSLFANVFKQLEGKIEKLAVQKFSSNVVEKCLERANYYRTKFIKEIINGDPASMMKNSFGNYVFQKALALAKGIDKFVIVDVIFRNFPMIQDQQIKMKWVKLLKKHLKQEDVLEADEEQDTLNLEIDQMVNYSHRYKLINDEISRYDKGSSKKEKSKPFKKKNFAAEMGYTPAEIPVMTPAYHQPYPPNMFYQGGVPPMPMYPHQIPQQPMQGYPMSPSYPMNPAYPINPTYPYPHPYQGYPGQGGNSKRASNLVAQ